MFTDGPVTPMRLETLVDLLRQLSRRKFDRSKILRLLQPEALPEVKIGSKRDQAVATLKAAHELGLITEEEEGTLNLTFEKDDRRTTNMIVLDALDERVLGGSTEPEPYFALFYSYLLSLGEKGGREKSGNDWEIEFVRDVFGGQHQPNPFNPTKYNGLRRWFRYAGLGWHDSADVFQPNPFGRLIRRLPLIFGDRRKLRGEVFMAGLGQKCPELDGGEIFRIAARDWSPDNKTCTLGLSQALIELHLEKKIRLHCPEDSRGWSIAKAAPPRDDTLKSGKIEVIEFLAGGKRRLESS